MAMINHAKAGQSILKRMAMSAETPEEKRSQAELDRSVDMARLIVRETTTAYLNGELTQARFIDIICKASEKPSHADITHDIRRSWVGDAVLKAHRSPLPPKGKRGQKGAPTWHRRAAVAGLKWAKQNGGVISRERKSGKPSAYQMVADYLTGFGLATTPGQVEEWKSSGQYGK